jgi:hypothetical protein
LSQRFALLGALAIADLVTTLLLVSLQASEVLAAQLQVSSSPEVCRRSFQQYMASDTGAWAEPPLSEVSTVAQADRKISGETARHTIFFMDQSPVSRWNGVPGGRSG